MQRSACAAGETADSDLCTVRRICQEQDGKTCSLPKSLRAHVCIVVQTIQSLLHMLRPGSDLAGPLRALLELP